MAEAARSLKANPKLAGRPCGWCTVPVPLGAELRLCTACETVHHAACWDGRAGCSQAGCLNAPLVQLDPVAAYAAPREVPPGCVTCPSCAAVVFEDAVCSQCKAILSPDGIYHGPQILAPGAVASLVWGIVGLFAFGLIVGMIAISKSGTARAAIKSNPRYSGQGLAIAGLVMGIVDIIGWGALLIMKASR